MYFPIFFSVMGALLILGGAYLIATGSLGGLIFVALGCVSFAQARDSIKQIGGHR